MKNEKVYKSFIDCSCNHHFDFAKASIISYPISSYHLDFYEAFYIVNNTNKLFNSSKHSFSVPGNYLFNKNFVLRITYYHLNTYKRFRHSTFNDTHPPPSSVLKLLLMTVHSYLPSFLPSAHVASFKDSVFFINRKVFYCVTCFIIVYNFRNLSTKCIIPIIIICNLLAIIIIYANIFFLFFFFLAIAVFFLLLRISPLCSFTLFLLLSQCNIRFYYLCCIQFLFNVFLSVFLIYSTYIF